MSDFKPNYKAVSSGLTILILTTMITFLAFQKNGFSSKKSAWLNAGPLSAVAETAVEVVVAPEKIKAPPVAEEKIVEIEAEPIEKQPFNFLSWLKQLMGYNEQ